MTTSINRPSQKQRILNLLKLGPVCGTDFLRYNMPRGAARINELRNEGHIITTRPCQLHEHETHQVVYELASDEMDQLRWILT